jgi:hypothetical protein
MKKEKRKKDITKEAKKISVRKSSENFSPKI